MSLATRLKDLRLESGQSLQEVADGVQASKPHIWELERGTSKNPSLELIKRLAGYFGVTVDYLAGTADDSNSEDPILLNFFREIKANNLDPSDLDVLKAAASALNKKKKND